MSDESEGKDALGTRPPLDTRARAVARTRIGNALFATQDRVTIGRYQLLKRAGAGGMGVVWSAWDPQLERRVAIKVVKVRGTSAREQLLREGQILAQLSHPNIVPIYDVGTTADEVYLVMEWIDGTTLRAFVEGARTVNEIVAVFQAAGAGVAAAHHAGIVQRDFKPDNVMIGGDGRVRVLDFGLARPTSEGGVAGTPRYMAPEQARGEPVTPAADQYAFGVALRESLATCGTLPPWLAAITTRATAEEPVARFRDMDALLAALARDPARVWRRRALVATAIVAAGAAFVVGSLRGGDESVAPCGGADAALAGVWSPERAAAIVTHLRTLGPYGSAEAPRVVDELGTYGGRWASAHRGACMAQRRGELTATLYEASLRCLGRSRAALDAIAGALGRVSGEQLPNAVRATHDLPDATRCVADTVASPVDPPPAAVATRVADLDAAAARARTLAFATDTSAGKLARETAAAAAELGYRPLVARAQLALGAALERDPTSPRPAAIDAYRAAADAALASGDDVTFVEAFARQLHLAARRDDPRTPELVAVLPYVSTIATRFGARGAFARALLYNNAGVARLAAGDRAGAIAWFRQARAARAPGTPGVELEAILGNLAMLVDDPRERASLFSEERARLERALGPDHPFTLQARLRAVAFIEDPVRHVAALGPLCATYAALHPNQTDTIATCHYDLGWLAVERGDTAAARRAYRAASAPSRPSAKRDLAEAELMRLDGDPARARTLAEAVARDLEAATTWWDRVTAIDAWLAIAAARTAEGAQGPAIAALERARAITRDPALAGKPVFVQRRRARVAALLARARADPALAAEAVAWYREAGGYDAAIAAIAAP